MSYKRTEETLRTVGYYQPDGSHPDAVRAALAAYIRCGTNWATAADVLTTMSEAAEREAEQNGNAGYHAFAAADDHRNYTYAQATESALSAAQELLATLGIPCPRAPSGLTDATVTVTHSPDAPTEDQTPAIHGEPAPRQPSTYHRSQTERLGTHPTYSIVLDNIQPDGTDGAKTKRMTISADQFRRIAAVLTDG